jgi:hypothetical protein
MTRENMQKRCQGVQDTFFGVADLVKNVVLLFFFMIVKGLKMRLRKV